MTNKRTLISSIAAGAIVLLAAVLFLAPSDPADHAPLPRLAQPDGETVGWVSKVQANTIHVNSGPFGGGVVALVVTRDTQITVGAKEGWFEDIRPGGQVKVSYDMFEGRRMARTVEILVDEGARRLTRVEPRVKGTTGTTTERGPAAAKGRAESPPAAAEEVAERAAVPAPAPTTPAATFGEKPTATSGEKPPAMASEKQAAMVSEKPGGSPPPPSRVVRAADAERGRPSNAGRSGDSHESARVREAPARVPTAVRPAEPGRAESGGTTDGSEAVDWLLKQRN
ncbi:MAG TPA: hypothetical protein VFT36_09660 [Methylomirabilota bacterium]|nr:hypothetical protein [Methylomirabilota bacterium]